MYGWVSTLHAFASDLGADRQGIAHRYGGKFSDGKYGPGGDTRCIDTLRPVEVAVSFPVDDRGSLVAMEVTLSQAGRPCALSARLDSYNRWDVGAKKLVNTMPSLTEALRSGMTPVISYWNSYNMGFMDGPGPDGKGPCAADAPQACPESVRFYGFSIADIGEVACEWGDWQAWSDCSCDSGSKEGKRVRTRHLPKEGSQECPGHVHQLGHCDCAELERTTSGDHAEPRSQLPAWVNPWIAVMMALAFALGTSMMLLVGRLCQRRV